MQTIASQNISDYVILSKKNKKKEEAEELLNIWTKLTESRATLPTFVAARLQRIPHGEVSAPIDTETITSLLYELRKDVTEIKTAQAQHTIPLTTQHHPADDPQPPINAYIHPLSEIHFPPLNSQNGENGTSNDNNKFIYNNKEASNENNNLWSNHLSNAPPMFKNIPKSKPISIYGANQTTEGKRWPPGPNAPSTQQVKSNRPKPIVGKKQVGKKYGENKKADLFISRVSRNIEDEEIKSLFSNANILLLDFQQIAHEQAQMKSYRVKIALSDLNKIDENFLPENIECRRFYAPKPKPSTTDQSSTSQRNVLL